jgi:cytoskeletal protein CcmA (bactofilin family)
MWRKKRDEEPAMLLVLPADTQAVAAAPVPMSLSPMESKKEALPVSSMPFGGRITPENIGSATIGKAVKVVGQIYSKEDLFVDGDLEGTVEALEHKLTIGPNGTVHADVKAREITMLGSLQGDVEATDKIEIRKDAKLVGNSPGTSARKFALGASNLPQPAQGCIRHVAEDLRLLLQMAPALDSDAVGRPEVSTGRINPCCSVNLTQIAQGCKAVLPAHKTLLTSSLRCYAWLRGNRK